MANSRVPLLIKRFPVLVPVVAAAMVLGAGVALATVAVKPAATWGVNGRVMAILPIGDRVVLGGSFTAVVDRAGVTRPAASLAVINTSTGMADTSWAGGTNGTVNALAVLNGQLFAGGNFSNANGQGRSDLAAFDAATGALQPWQATVGGGSVDALTIAGGSLYAGGNFSNINGSPRSFAAKLDASTGALDTGWSPSPDARVRALTASGSTVFLGGDFTRPTNKVAAVSATTGVAVAGFRAVANNGSGFGPVFGLSNDGASLYEAVGGGGGACTSVSAASGAKNWSKHSNGNIHSVQRVGSDVYCGGHFSGLGSFDGQNRKKLAAVDAATGATLPFAPVVNSALGVWSLGTDGTRLFAGGDFTKVSRVLASHYAQFS